MLDLLPRWLGVNFSVITISLFSQRNVDKYKWVGPIQFLYTWSSPYAHSFSCAMPCSRALLTEVRATFLEESYVWKLYVVSKKKLFSKIVLVNTITYSKVNNAERYCTSILICSNMLLFFLKYATMEADIFSSFWVMLPSYCLTIDIFLLITCTLEILDQISPIISPRHLSYLFVIMNYLV